MKLLPSKYFHRPFEPVYINLAKDDLIIDRIARATTGGQAICDARSKDRDANRNDIGPNRLEDHILGLLGEEFGSLYSWITHNLLLTPDYRVYSDRQVRNRKTESDIGSLHFRTCHKYLNAGSHLGNLDSNDMQGVSFVFRHEEFRVNSYETDDNGTVTGCKYMYAEESPWILSMSDLEGRGCIVGFIRSADLRSPVLKKRPTYCKNMNKWKKAVYLTDLLDLNMLRPIYELTKDEMERRSKEEFWQ